MPFGEIHVVDERGRFVIGVQRRVGTRRAGGPTEPILTARELALGRPRPT